VRFDVGTANVFDATNPFFIASDEAGLLGFTLFQNEQSQVPGNRDVLNAYITPALNDAWNTAPYLHDGTAATLLDVVRPCDPALDDCARPAAGRNLCPGGACQHGATLILSARQLNDLVAFEKAPHGPIGEVRAVNGAVLNNLHLGLRFGRRPGTDRLIATGSGNVSRDMPFDPTASGLVFSLGAPAGETMAVFERTVPPEDWKVNRARTSFRFTDRRGTQLAGLRKILIRSRGGVVGFRLVATHVDLSALRGRNPDLTLGLEVGQNTLAATRRFRTNHKGTVTKGP